MPHPIATRPKRQAQPIGEAMVLLEPEWPIREIITQWKRPHFRAPKSLANRNLYRPQLRWGRTTRTRAKLPMWPCHSSTHSSLPLSAFSTWRSLIQRSTLSSLRFSSDLTSPVYSLIWLSDQLSPSPILPSPSIRSPSLSMWTFLASSATDSMPSPPRATAMDAPMKRASLSLCSKFSRQVSKPKCVCASRCKFISFIKHG